MFPSVWHRFKPDPETGWKEYWLEFSGDYLNGLLKDRIFREDKPVLKIGVDVELIQLYESIFELIRREPPDYHVLLGSKAVYFIAYLISTQKKRKMAGRSAEDIIAEAKTMLLDQSNTQKVDLQQIAVKLNLSFTVFRRLFKIYTGFSPRQFALQATVMKAKLLLGNTSKPVGMVAEELGFASVYYFSRFFLKKTGMTPTEFRRRRPVAQPDEMP
jgi:AraC-like DNA-binding protein